MNILDYPIFVLLLIVTVFWLYFISKDRKLGFRRLYKSILLKDIIHPYEEINAVLNANLTGDKFRRCSGHEAIDEINGIYSKINMILDKKSAGLESESDR